MVSRLTFSHVSLARPEWNRGGVGGMTRGIARLGIATAALALALAAMGGFPAAQQGGDAAKLAKARDVFDNYACGSCHSLSDAGATGHVGPAFDGNDKLTADFIVERVSNG